jgi:hypothetical protein
MTTNFAGLSDMVNNTPSLALLKPLLTLQSGEWGFLSNGKDVTVLCYAQTAVDLCVANGLTYRTSTPTLEGTPVNIANQ